MRFAIQTRSQGRWHLYLVASTESQVFAVLRLLQRQHTPARVRSISH